MSVVTNSSPVSAGNDALASEYNNLRLDVLAVEANSPPIGSIVMWAGATGDVPSGWDLCDGAEVSRTTYSTLFARLGTTFGIGNGSTTFNLPDLQDQFVVGAGDSYSRNDSGGSDTVDSAHTHAGPSHSHSVPSHVHTGPSHTHSIPAHIHGAGTYAAAYTRESQYTGYTRRRSSPSWMATEKITLYNSIADTTTVTHGIDVMGDSSSGGSGNSGSGGTGNTGAWSGTTGSAGTGSTGSAGSAALENRPPYVGLYYIIKIS